MEAKKQMMDPQCNTLRRVVIVINVSFRRGIWMLILIAVLLLSFAGNCSALLMPFPDSAI
jgi:hypothetical protein